MLYNTKRRTRYVILICGSGSGVSGRLTAICLVLVPVLVVLDV